MQKTIVAIFETNQGSFEVSLMPEVAPKAVENFVGLAKQGYYDGLVFHRVIRDFMIQGGDPTGTGRGGESLFGRNFEDEVTLNVKFNEKGLLAMANRGPNTNGSQFFITTAATPWLQNKHTIFGKVTKGYDIVDKIQNSKTGSQDRPVENQVIKKITIVE
ncbi:MAG: peptidylprolyl isomerase [Chlamydiae bacterium]|nr:peptidylprolyl isomerase [Chlamydiota bacterium]